MRRMMAAGVVALVVILLSAGVTQAGEEHRKTASPQRPTQELGIDAWLDGMDARIQSAPDVRSYLPEGPVNCGTLACLNRYLTQLVKGLNKFQDQMLKFKAEATLFRKTFNTCFRIIPVTQYGDPTGGTFGYAFSNDGTNFFLTSALDVTFEGDPIGAYMMIWRIADACPVVE